MERGTILQSYQIQDLKDFMKKLLLTDTFDTFLLSEASVTTYAAFHLDGTMHPDYFSTDEAESLTTEQCGYVLWKRVRPLFFELMKGKKHTALLSDRFSARSAQRRIPDPPVRTLPPPGGRGRPIFDSALRRDSSLLHQRKFPAHFHAGPITRPRLGCDARKVFS